MDLFLNSFLNAVVAFLPLILAITLHEAAHGYVALKCGDDTALREGRISMNPFRHVDLVGTLLIPGFLYLAKAPFLIGYAKPVPVNMNRLHHPRRDMVFVALAGPAMNIALMIAGVVLLKISVGMEMDPTGFFVKFAIEMMRFNAIIALFNMIPILPLDGGRVLLGILPMGWARSFARHEPYGMFIVFGAALILPWLLHIDPIGWFLRNMSIGLLSFMMWIFGLH